MMDGLPAGELLVSLQGGDLLSVDLASWRAFAAPRFTDATIAAATARAVEGALSPETLAEAGVTLHYDPARLLIEVTPAPEARRVQPVSLGPGGDPGAATATAPLALYLNGRAVQDYVVESSFAETGRLPLQVALDGAVRVLGQGGAALEGTAYWNEADSRLVRGPVRAVYDDPQRAIRYSAGDVFYTAPSYFGAPPLLGLSMERQFGALQPLRSVAAAGRESFTLGRASRVEVYVNGVFQKVLQLAPGRYNLTDLTASDGLNDIQIVIEDDTGRRETLVFTLVQSASLLARGLSEFSLNAGFPRIDHASDELDYDYDRPALSAFFRYGALDRITLGGSVQGDDRVQVVGAEAVVGSGAGVFSAAYYASTSDFGPGQAAAAGWVYNLARSSARPVQSFELALSYVSDDYMVLGRSMPANPTVFDASFRYTGELPGEVVASLSASYRRLRGEPEPDQYGAGLALSRSFALGTANVRAEWVDGARPETAVFLGFSVPLSTRQGLSAGYDSRAKRSRVEWSRQPQEVVGDIAARVGMETLDGRTAAQGEVVYRANRFVAGVRHDFSQAGFLSGPREQRTRVQLAGAAAWIDGTAAWGRPVSDAFAVVSRHDSLKGTPLHVNESPAGPVAIADRLGPALVNLGSYHSQVVAWDAAAPTGYDLGDTQRRLLPAYRAGFAFQAGSSASFTAMGTALRPDGAPLALVAGVVRTADGRPFEPALTFTNRSGRFSVLALEPGRYTIEFAGSPPLTAEFEVLAGGASLLELGTLKMKEA